MVRLSHLGFSRTILSYFYAGNWGWNVGFNQNWGFLGVCNGEGTNKLGVLLSA